MNLDFMSSMSFIVNRPLKEKNIQSYVCDFTFYIHFDYEAKCPKSTNQIELP